MRSWHSDEKTGGEAPVAGNDEESNKASEDESKAKNSEEKSSDIVEADEEEMHKLPSENIVDQLCDEEEKETSPGFQKFQCLACDYLFSS